MEHYKFCHFHSLLNISTVMSVDLIPVDYFNAQEDVVIPRHGNEQQWETIEERWQTMNDSVSIPKGLLGSASDTSKESPL